MTRRTLTFFFTAFFALSMAGGSLPARAQIGGQSIPDLSGIADAINQSAQSAAEPSNRSNVFSSELTVPSVHPGATAIGIAHQLRVSVEAKSGPQPALARLEATMPQVVTGLEGQLVKVGLAKRDFGVAVAFAFAFVTNWETANGHEISQSATVKAARRVASAVGKRWGSKYKSLAPAAQEKAYESLLVSPFLLSTFATQFDKAGKTQEAAGIRQTAGDVFQKLIGVPPSQVRIGANGVITGLASSQATHGPAQPAALPPPAKGDLKPSRIAGVYAEQVNEVGAGGFVSVVFDPVLALKDGTYCEELEVPPSDFHAAASRRAHPKDWGRWRGSPHHIETLSDKGQWEKANWIGPLSGGGPGQRLSGTFTSIGGGGNVAFDGTVMVAVEKSFTFSPDGHFHAGSSASASTGSATVNSGSHASGTYTLGQYALTLHFADGTMQRWSYAKMDEDLLCIHGERYINDKKL